MGKIWKWFGGAGVVLIAAIVAFQLVPKSDRKETTSAAGGTPAKSPVPSAGANASQPVQAAPAVIAARPADPPAAKEPEKTTATAPVQTAVAVLPAKLAADARGDAEAVARKEAERKKAEEELARLKRETEEKRLAEEKSKAELAAKAEAAKMAALAAEKEKALAAAAQQAREAAILTKPASTEPAVRTEAASASTGLPAGSFTNSLSMIFVRLPMGYWAGRTEVTEAQFKQVMGPEVRVAAVGAEHPVHEVSWNEATEFCQKLSESERKSGWLQKGWAYGLPTEAQWAEFVGDAKLEDSVTSYKLPKQRTRPEPVGSTQRANQFGLFDVRGNVWEWCFSTNSQKTARGGAYNGVTDRTVGLDATWSLGPEGRRQDIGFRCVMVPER